MTNDWVVGIFVGGRGRRLGGVAKGLLPAPGSGGTLVSRLVRVVLEALPHNPIVLVGQSDGYAELALPALSDAIEGAGPLGGLAALVAHAGRAGHRGAIALSCDLPYLGPVLVERLAREFPDAAALAPRTGGRWSALTARYASSTLPTIEDGLRSGAYALQRVFTLLGNSAVELPLAEAEQAELRDWDTPEDIRGG